MLRVGRHLVLAGFVHFLQSKGKREGVFGGGGVKDKRMSALTTRGVFRYTAAEMTAFDGSLGSRNGSCVTLLRRRLTLRRSVSISRFAPDGGDGAALGAVIC